MQLADLLWRVSLFVSLPAFVYIAKHPLAKGERYGREHKLLWISIFLSAVFLLAAGFVQFASPLSTLLIVVAICLALPTVVYFAKHPLTKGEPFGRTHKLMMIPFLLSFCCLIAAGYFPLFARP
jgi:TRAP-type uncharacterized transport system fused permease subunit